MLQVYLLLKKKEKKVDQSVEFLIVAVILIVVIHLFFVCARAQPESIIVGQQCAGQAICCGFLFECVCVLIVYLGNAKRLTYISDTLAIKFLPCMRKTERKSARESVTFVFIVRSLAHMHAHSMQSIAMHLHTMANVN